jgi:cobalt-precorrin 5A hydrolase
MKLALWHVRESARPLAKQLALGLDAIVLPAEEAADGDKFAPGDPSNREQFAAAFPKADGWVLLMATGIATRYLAGLPRDKHRDPAVVVVDEACRFAIPVLAGHEGGGNALAYRIANLTGALPVITTATEALKPLTLGIGLRRGLGADRIESAVSSALSAAGACIGEVREVATVDIKAREPGLIKWLEEKGLPLRVFSSLQLADRPLTAAPSDWVRSNVGLAGVCEPCALLASPRGTLLVPKHARAGVTVAIVADHFTALHSGATV